MSSSITPRRFRPPRRQHSQQSGHCSSIQTARAMHLRVPRLRQCLHAHGSPRGCLYLVCVDKICCLAYAALFEKICTDRMEPIP
eukprot:15442792-Alexandrium_andersonii.AAC.1